MNGLAVNDNGQPLFDRLAIYAQTIATGERNAQDVAAWDILCEVVRQTYDVTAQMPDISPRQRDEALLEWLETYVDEAFPKSISFCSL